MTADKKQVLISLKKAHSHIARIIKMIEDGEYCIDVIQQMNAIIGYLHSARNRKLTEHLNSCFAQGMKSTDEKKKEKLIDELVQALNMRK